MFLAGLTILKKVRCLGVVGGCGADPVVALHLRNAADYRLPTFGSHGTKLGHSWYQWIIKVIFLAGLTFLKKVRCLGRLSGCRGWSRCCTPPKKWCRLPPTYFLTTWHQTWATWHQTRAFLISVNNKKWFFWLVWQFWKRRGVWAYWVDLGLILRLHSTWGMLQTTAYLLFDHMATI